MKLYAADAADRMAQQTGQPFAVSTWRDYYNKGLTPGAVVTGPGRRPGSQRRADGVDLERGHVRPWWLPETVDAFAARPNKRPRPPRPDRSKES